MNVLKISFIVLMIVPNIIFCAQKRKSIDQPSDQSSFSVKKVKFSTERYIDLLASGLPINFLFEQFIVQPEQRAKFVELGFLTPEEKRALDEKEEKEAALLATLFLEKLKKMEEARIKRQREEEEQFQKAIAKSKEESSQDQPAITLEKKEAKEFFSDIKESFIDKKPDNFEEYVWKDIVKCITVEKIKTTNDILESLRNIMPMIADWRTIDLKNLHNHQKFFMGIIQRVDEQMRVKNTYLDKIHEYKNIVAKIQQVPCLYQGYWGLDKIYGGEANVLCGFYAPYFLDKMLVEENKFLESLNNRSDFHSFFQNSLTILKEKKEVTSLHLTNQEIEYFSNNSLVGIHNGEVTPLTSKSKDSIDKFYEELIPHAKLGLILQIAVNRGGYQGHWIAITLQKNDNTVIMNIADSRGVDRINPSIDNAIEAILLWFIERWNESRRKKEKELAEVKLLAESKVVREVVPQPQPQLVDQLVQPKIDEEKKELAVEDKKNLDASVIQQDGGSLPASVEKEQSALLGLGINWQKVVSKTKALINSLSRFGYGIK